MRLSLLSLLQPVPGAARPAAQTTAASPLRRLLFLFGVAAALAGSCDTPGPGAPTDPASPGASQPAPGAMGGTVVGSATDKPGLSDPALRAAYIRTRQAEGQASPPYHLRAVAGSGAFLAQHPTQGYQARITPSGMSVQVGADDFTLALRGVACGDRLTPAAPAREKARQHRLELSRGPLSEWYENGPLGLEQGFDLAARPACTEPADTAPVRIELALAGTLKPRAEGSGMALYRPEAAPPTGLKPRAWSQPALRYAELFASDADGKPLPAQMELSADGKRLALVVKDHGARYPLHIDPLTYVQETILTASNKAAFDQLGNSVSLSADGSRALVGARLADPGAFNDAGAAYVYTRSALGVWTQEAILSASNKAVGDQFGTSVSLSADGSRALVGSLGADPGAISEAGAAYVYARSGLGVWSEEAILTASNKAFADLFGYSVSLSGDGSLALVGAVLADPGAVGDAGAAYVFGPGKPNGASCAAGGECISGFCVDSVCCNTACAGGTADCQACSTAAGATTNGSCGAASNTTTCRPAAPGKPCDQAETCDGTSLTCPADTFLNGNTCRPAAAGKVCDVAETCNGASPDCPPDQGTPNTTLTCRNAVGLCDLAETCDGSSPNCPADAKRGNGATCRAAAGACDAPETCDGISTNCPANAMRPPGSVCKAAGASATCDPADTCDGLRSSCPARFAPYGTACGASMSCNGTGRCL